MDHTPREVRQSDNVAEMEKGGLWSCSWKAGWAWEGCFFLDSLYHTDSRTSNDKSLSSLQWKVSHRWFHWPWTISSVLVFLHRGKSSSPHQGLWWSATFLYTVYHPFNSIPVPCPHQHPDQVSTPPSNPLLLPLLWFLIILPVPHLILNIVS